MNFNVADVFVLFERRLLVLGQLVRTLSDSLPRTPEANIPFLEQRNTEQCSLLSEWSRIEGEIEHRRREQPELFSKAAENCALPPETKTRWLGYREQYLGRLRELLEKCRVEAAVLRRSRRTAAALSSLLTVSDSTYSIPLRAGVPRSSQ